MNNEMSHSDQYILNLAMQQAKRKTQLKLGLDDLLCYLAFIIEQRNSNDTVRPVVGERGGEGLEEELAVGEDGGGG